MIAEIRWEWIWLLIRKDQCADGVEQSARNEQGDGSHTELVVNGTDQKNNDPAHQQKTDVGYPDRNLGEENGLERNKENRQTPDDAE